MGSHYSVRKGRGDPTKVSSVSPLNLESGNGPLFQQKITSGRSCTTVTSGTPLGFKGEGGSSLLCEDRSPHLSSVYSLCLKIDVDRHCSLEEGVYRRFYHSLFRSILSSKFILGLRVLYTFSGLYSVFSEQYSSWTFQSLIYFFLLIIYGCDSTVYNFSRRV